MHHVKKLQSSASKSLVSQPGMFPNINQYLNNYLSIFVVMYKIVKFLTEDMQWADKITVGIGHKYNQE